MGSEVERFFHIQTTESETRKGKVSVSITTDCKNEIEIRALLCIAGKDSPEMERILIKVAMALLDPRCPGAEHYEVSG